MVSANIYSLNQVTHNPDFVCGLVGHPVSHSLSPKIHQHFAEQFDIDLQYRLIDTPPEKLFENIAVFFAENGQGLNVTVPHKREAYAACTRHSVVSKVTRTVNTLWQDDDGNLCGDNTDASGFIRDLRLNHNMDVKDKRVLIMGTGGASRGVIPALMVQNPSELYISSRTFKKAKKLAESYKRGRALPFDIFGEDKRPFDLIINATPASLYGALPDLEPFMIGENTYCMDMAYTKSSTIFCDWAQENGAKRAWDGLGMLIEQAADSFRIWFKQRPDTREIYKQRYSLIG